MTVIITKRVLLAQFIIQYLSCSSFFLTNNAFFNKIYPTIEHKRSRWFHECVDECNYAVRSSRSVILSTTSDSMGQTDVVNEKNSGKLPLPFMNVESIGLSGRWIQQGGNFILKPQFNGSMSSSSSINM